MAFKYLLRQTCFSTTARASQPFFWLGWACLWALLAMACGGQDDPPTPPGSLVLASARVGTTTLGTGGTTANVPWQRPIVLAFDKALDLASTDGAIGLFDESGPVAFSLDVLNSGRTLSVAPDTPLAQGQPYRLEVGDGLLAADGGAFAGAVFRFTTGLAPLALAAITLDGADFEKQGRYTDIARKDLAIRLVFSHPVAKTDLEEHLALATPDGPVALDISPSANEGLAYEARPAQTLANIAKHTLALAPFASSADGRVFAGFANVFHTVLDTTDFQLPPLGDEALLDLVQSQTFRYFWDFAHPASGMVRERNTSGNLVTAGGSGFGAMAIMVGIHRGWVSRQQGVARWQKMVGFLASADRFHGAWPHWMNGETGRTIPFGPDDDGGDLVETALLVQGLLAVRQYLDPLVASEAALIDDITALWEGVEWDWYTRGGQNTLFWHWSPNVGWAKNLRISGWNESLIAYVLAAASPTHPIPASAYHQGWARNGNMRNGQAFYETSLPLGPDFGGPLFFSHYSFLGLDPRKLVDGYADYWQQQTRHSLINRAHCIANPNNYVGYGAACWGLTASDSNQGGYNAHSPTNDLGVVTPTAALSAMPFVPEASMAALRRFYFLLGDRLWGQYGFYDAFNLTDGWVADSYLAIDQGPIIIMVENHRSALVWDTFMQDAEIRQGLDKLGFTSY